MRLAVSLAVVALSALAASAADPKKPNVIVILSDDVGYGEYGFQGCKDIPTPNIDSIAKNGVRFTSGYVAATYCCPTPGGADDRHATRRGSATSSTRAATGGRQPRFGLPLDRERRSPTG